MKKVKTILTSLIIILATAFMTACSCGGDGDDAGEIIPVSTISITSDFAGAERDEETGYLTIQCTQNDTFNITYTLNPSNTTRTQVDWSFVGGDDIVRTVKNYYSYSQDYYHTVNFKAKSVGTTIIRFVPKGTDKYTQAYVRVGAERGAWPTFVKPTNVDYNANTGCVTWSPVRQVWRGGQLVNVADDKNIAQAPNGYEVTYTNLETNETGTKLVGSECKVELPRGNTYAVNIVAKGDNFTVNDSDRSDTFTYHQIGAVSDLKNNNGVLTYTSPKHAETNRIYYSTSDALKDKYIETSKTTLTIDENSTINSFSNYDFSIISLPQGYAEAVTKGNNYIINSQGVRIYPSVKSENLNVIRLKTPVISMEYVQDNITVGEVEFTKSGDYTPNISTILKWRLEGEPYLNTYAVEYVYEIVKLVNNSESSKVKGRGSVENSSYSQFDLSTTLNNAINEVIQNSPGDYRLKVYTIGNSSTSIPSSVSTYDFRVLDKVDKNSVVLTKNILTTSDANAVINGVDLYFVNKSNPNKSQYVFVPAEASQKNVNIDITTLGLNAGTYDIYARNIGFDTTNFSSVTGQLSLVCEGVTISNPIEQDSIKLLNNGVLQFNKVANVDVYTITVTKDNTTFTYNFGFKQNGEELYRSYENPGYTLNNGICSISIYDLIGHELLSKDNVTSENIEAEIANFTNSTVEFTISSKGDGDMVVDSGKSQKLTFARLRAVDRSNISLSGENLQFTTDYTSRSAVISINGHSATVSINESNSINLKDYLSDGKTLYDYAKPEYASLNSENNLVTKIVIYIIGNTSTIRSPGWLSSFETYKEISYTSTPNSVNLDKDGNLTWKLDELNTQNFNIRFYTKNDGIWTEARDPYNVSVTSEQINVGTEEESSMENIFTYNIFDIISSIGANTNIGITIEHIDKSRFTNVASQMFYVIQLSNVTLSKVLDNDNPAIEFTALNVDTTGIIYQIDVIKGDNHESTETYNDLEKNVTYRKTIMGDLNVSGVGKYTIRLIAYREGNASNSVTTPFVLSSVAEELTIEILDPRIVAYGDGTMVKWNVVHNDATYKLYYKANGASDYVLVVGDDGEAIIFDKDNHAYDLKTQFSVGENIVKVVPGIDFVNTGCMFTADQLRENTIIKLDKISDITTNNGCLTFKINEDLSSYATYNIGLFVDGKLVSSDRNMYTCTFELVTSGEAFDHILGTINILSSQYLGEHTYSIQVNASGAISSEISDSYTATKISTPNDIEKIGDYIIWAPVDNATMYALTIVKSGATESVTKYIRFNGTTVTVEITNEDNSKAYLEDTNIAKFENGKLMYKFDSALLGVEATAGDYYYTITPYTDINTYLNGVTSGALTITKLSNDLTIEVNGESIVLKNYRENGAQIPTTVDYEISRFKTTETTTPDESGEGETTTVETTILSTKSGSVDYNSIKDLITSSDGYALNLNTLGVYEAGRYLIKVTFKGDGNSILDSNEIVDNTLTKLGTSNLTTKDGEITWVAVDGANSYTIEVTKLGVTSSESTLDTSDETEGGEETPDTPEINNWSFVLSFSEGDKLVANETNLVLEDGTNFKFETGKEYSVKLMANGLSLSSRWSSEFIVKKLQAPTNLNIVSTNGKITYIDKDGIEQSINIGDPMLTWSNPNQVISRLNYMLSIVGERDTEDIIIYNTSDQSELLGQLLPKDKAIGNYTLKLKTIGNTTTGTNQIGLLTSNYSYEDIVGDAGTNPVARYISDVYNIKLSQRQFAWANVLGAYGYRISFYEGMTVTGAPVYSTYVTTNSYDFRNTEFAGSGYYTVVINAITDPSKSIVSTYVDSENPAEPTNISTLYKSSDVTNLMVKDGMLSWSFKVSDIKEMLAPHASIDGDILVTKLNVTETGDKKQTQLLTNTLDYIVRKIKQNADGDAEVDKVISSLYNFRLSLNGKEMDVIPHVANVVAISEVDGKKTYTIKQNSYLDTDLLMFKYNLSVNTTGDLPDGVESTDAGKYVVRTAPLGNNVNSGDKGLYTSVDGKYSSEIIVYKPNTPSPWVRAEEDALAKQISDGNIMWSLVTTDDSTPEQFEYHQNYMLTAVSNENKDEIRQVALNVNDTVITEEGELQGTNPNLKDNCNYFRYLKEGGSIFGIGTITPNTNYTLKINVIGTEDSALLAEHEKAYLNSDMFTYTEYMNILANLNTSVSESKLQWTPCDDSTATKVVIYGPFTNADGTPNYAPIEPERVDFKTSEEYETALTEWKDAVKVWKESINDQWTEASNPNNKTLRHEFIFPANIAGDGDDTIIERVKSYTLTDTLDDNGKPYGAGSYIIRKAEIGNGKGVISTDFSESLFVNEYELADYELIATKLDKVSKYAYAEDNGWTKDGKFAWNNVPHANAYSVTLEKCYYTNEDNNLVLKVADNGTITEAVYTASDNDRFTPIKDSNGEIVAWAYELPDNSLFNEAGFTYRVRVTALHVRNTKDISNNYFNSDEVTTDDYGRSTAPSGLTVNGEGLITWNVNSQDSSGKGYIIRLNYGTENVHTDDIVTKDNTYDLSKFNQTGIIRFFVKTYGGTGFLSSCNATVITVNKLATPLVTIKDGVFTWGTESTDVSGEQLTDTVFNLNNGQILETLPIGVTRYPLYTEITSFNQEYKLANDNSLPVGEYTFAVKYKGDEGENDGTKVFNIASPSTNFKATKLGATALENVEIATGSTTENKIKWTTVDNALGYRAVVLTGKINPDGSEQIWDKIYNTQVVGEGETKKYGDNDIYFEVIGNEVYLNLSKVIEELGGANKLKVYVQAIGQLDYIDEDGNGTEKDKIYLSGSFSDVKVVTIPAKPMDATYDDKTGVISWKVDNVNDGHNVKLTTQYKIENVSTDDFNNYWTRTATTYTLKSNDLSNPNAIINGEDKDRYSEIINRHFDYTEVVLGTVITGYNIEVTDTVFLTANKGITPTSYQLTNIASNYVFDIIVLVGDGNYNGIYRSEVCHLEHSGTNGYTFTTFKFGDGSSLLPYGIGSKTQFESIRNFTDRHFVVTEDISLNITDGGTDTWEIIMDDFTGSIDGGNYTILDVYTKENVQSYGAYNDIKQAMFNVNKGTIKNLNIEISSQYVPEKTINNAQALVSGLVIENHGTIDNVHITNIFGNSIKANYIGATDQTMVAGIAIYNGYSTSTNTVIDSAKDRKSTRLNSSH